MFYSPTEKYLKNGADLFRKRSYLTEGNQDYKTEPHLQRENTVWKLAYCSWFYAVRMAYVTILNFSWHTLDTVGWNNHTAILVLNPLNF